METILRFFEKNTDATGTNKGFYFQYLNTLQEWLSLFFSNDTVGKIHCEYEDDLRFENGSSLVFKQYKCYKKELKLSSNEVKSSIYPKFGVKIFQY